MGTRFKISIAILCIYANVLQVSGNGCEIDGIVNWNLPIVSVIRDVDSGDIFRASTANIQSITYTFTDALNDGPYMDVSHENSVFVLETNEKYEWYEEYETLENMGVTVQFNCADGTTRTLIFFISVRDTNNNDPIFENDVIELAVTPPLVPGFVITNAINEIRVRDIDLTTEGIDFEIIGESIFTINETEFNTAKEFRAALRTTAFIRNIPEPLEITIRATDVDRTGDPRRSNYATIRIVSDGQFELPQELIFNQTFYMATYTENNEIVLQEPISLLQGYDTEVQFTLPTIDEYTQYFDIVSTGNNVALTLRGDAPLPAEVLSQGKLFLVVRADREYTTGTSATIIVQLPEVPILLFEKINYGGTIVDGVLDLPQLILTQGYENEDIDLEIKNDYNSFFNYNIQGNVITISMVPLDTNIIEQNSFLVLEIVAVTGRSSATTIVTLEIIKDDTVTPVFDSSLYSGSYDPDNGLLMEQQITFTQGYEDTEVYLEGEYQDLFEVSRTGQTVILTVDSIPISLFARGHLLITIKATKPRTVGANAAISIALPAETDLLFEKPNYEGKIVDNVLDLPQLLLTQGYEDQEISVEIRNEHNSFFTYNIEGNVLTILMSPLDTNIIEQNSFLVLEIVAVTGRSSATTIVTLEIIKDDTVTPVFDSRLYSGSYDPDNGLSMEQQITFTQGYEDTEVYLEGENQGLFEVNRNGQNVILTVDSIPISLFASGHLLITIKATKPRTVGANAAISIALPAETDLLFESPNYEGKIVDNVLDLPQLLLTQGYEDQEISVDIRNEHNSFFTYNIQNNVITILMSPLDTNIIEQNSFLVLEIVAATGRSSTTTIVTLEIIKDDTVTPVFDSRLYSGSYDPDNGLSMEQQITFTQGYEDTEVYLEGEHQDLFQVSRTGLTVILTVDSIPISLFARGHLLITIKATKPRTVGANAAISIALPAETDLLFERPNYEGKIVDNVLDLPQLLLTQGYEDQEISVEIRNEYNTFFTYNVQDNVIKILMSPLDTIIIEQNSFLVLEIVAGTGRSSATTIVTLEIIKDDTVTPVFDSRLYSGSYDPDDGLSMEQQITFTQGYEDTEVYLEGEYRDLFEVIRTGQIVNLSIAHIPTSLFTEGPLLITIKATKTRTVGANAAITIALPAEVGLLFERPNYEGKIIDNVLDIPPILLTQGYEDQDISLTIRNEHNQFFTYNIQGNVITISMSPLDTNIIAQNSFLVLEIVAATGRSSATTIVTLEIIKDDTVTPVFDSRLYSGDYDPDTGLLMEQQITFIQGYEDSEVYLEGEHQDLFEVSRTGQSVILTVDSIPINLFARGHLLITIKAAKPRTVGANAAISITLPGAAEVELLFEMPNYEGKIEDNVLDLPQLLLAQGYEDQEISVEIRNEHNQFFTYNIQSNVITISMSPLDTNIIAQNSFLVLEIVAATGRSFATTIVTLEIIKDDTVTPVFDSRLYSGSYDPDTGLLMEQQITFIQGYEDSEVYLEGEHQDLFEVSRTGQTVILTVDSIPINLFARGHLLITIKAAKPRTVGANAAISITLPGAAEVELLFEMPNYEGKIEDNVLDLPQLLLTQGYEDQEISVEIRNEHNQFFTYNIQGNVITISMSPLDTNIIAQNSFLVLEIVAATGRSSATTIVTLEIIKDDTVTPVFDSRLYIGSYDPDTGLLMEQQITFIQGYEDSEVYLEGEHQDLFEVSRTGQTVILTVDSIPINLFARGHLLITIKAAKPRTVGANAAISITLPGAAEVELLFEMPNYEGKIEDNVLDLPQLLLTQGYEDQEISVEIRNEHNQFFTYNIQGNVITISMSPLDTNIIAQNSFLVLEIVAATGRSSATTIVTLEIIKDDTVTPVFDSRLYIGSYDPDTGLLMEQQITFIQGYEDSEVYLEGEHQDLFEVSRTGQTVILTVDSIPINLFARGHLLITIKAAKPRTVGANAAISITLPGAAEVELLFEMPNYEGKIEDNVLDLPQLLLTQGYEDQEISVEIRNEHNQFFTYNIQGNVITISMSPLDTNIIAQNSFLVLEIVAATGRSSATTIVTLEIIKDDTVTPVFDSRLYIGSYDPDTGLLMEQQITFIQGYEDSEVYLEGEHQDLFEVSRTGQTVILTVDSIPINLFARGHLLITIKAAKPRTVGANAAISITLPGAAEVELLFEMPNYEGKIEDNVLDLPQLLLTQGYEDQEISVEIRNEHNQFFTYNIQGNVITISMSPLDTNIIAQNSFLVLEIVAATGRSSATTIVTLEIIKDDTVTPVFDSRLYIGSYDPDTGLLMEQQITFIQGYEDSEVYLEGEHQDLFEVSRTGQTVILTVDSIPINLFARGHLLITIKAAKPRTVGANAAISITLPGAAEVELLFEMPNYEGKIEDNVLDLPQLLLTQGYEDQEISVEIRNEHNQFFTYNIQGNVITISMSPLDTNIIAQNSFLVLEIVAATGRSSATTIVTLEIIKDDTVTPVFDSRLYSGSYDPDTGLLMEQQITFIQGYEDSEVYLEGEHQDLFEVSRTGQTVILTVDSIPISLFARGHLLITIKATKPRTVGANAAAFIALPASNSETDPAVIFNKILYEGIIQGGNLQHEIIILNGYDGTEVEIRGAFNTSFRAIHTDGAVEVDTVGSLILPPDTQHMALELRAGNAGAVLLIEVTDAEVPVIPIVTFSAPSYTIRAESGQFGVISRVQASADNGESITYSLRIDNEHLLTRISITDEGELRLTAPVNIGVYNFEVIATTIITREQGEAPVSLSVEAVVTCGDNEIATTPLIVIDRNEEEPHRNLIVLDSTQHSGCKYSMTNRWPANQQWLYVDDTGLHAYAIDREDSSIAFMALSQIQVELTLECESDPTRTKRSVDYDHLGPYDYGSKTWIITDTIEYNPRKTIVNLIVNDINDNHPIFIGKENEPIVVGYPVSELQSTILPRSLIELQATDADIGENAAIVFWSSESQLAVSSTTGFVHVKNDAELTDNMQLVVSATDLNGQGLTGTLLLRVKLLNANNIAVISVRDSFLEDEGRILSNISSQVGYEVKSLRSSVTLDTGDLDQETRNKRNVQGAEGGNLEIYLYGLLQGEPVHVNTLTNDINESSSNMAIRVSSILPLEEHLETLRLPSGSGNNVGLLVSTIILSVLLFIILVAGAVWFFIKRKRITNYEDFKDEISVSSGNESIKEDDKTEILTRPRLNIEELKRSEKRLQEMLSTPSETPTEVTVEPSSSTNNSTTGISMPDTIAPIVIQDRLKDAEDSDEDEFGERKKNRRKSVVTFNENVERIIHVEDIPDEESNDFEIYKL